MTNRRECFTYEESLSHPGYYSIQPNHEVLHLEHTDGSFQLICARLMCLTYANYLRMCRDLFDAEIYGKNCYYPVAYFKKTVGLIKLVHLLNTNANIVLNERERAEAKHNVPNT